MINRLDGNIIICVQDDGIGFDYANYELRCIETQKFGLFGIRERIKLLNGSVDINSLPGQGTSISLKVPLEAVN